MKGKNLQPRILYPARISFRFERGIKSFTDKQKLKQFSTTRTALQQMLKEHLKAEKKSPQLETRKLQMGKLTSKGKHTVKVGNHAHTNMVSKPVILRGGEYKRRIFEMHLRHTRLPPGTRKSPYQGWPSHACCQALGKASTKADPLIMATRH